MKTKPTSTEIDDTPPELKYATFNTDMGWVGIIGTERGLLGTTLPQPSAQQARRRLGDRIKYATSAPHHFPDLIKRLKAYFGGQQVAFPDELDLCAATPFQGKVWQITRLIPYGRTRSYRWVAEQIGQPGAARAVGQALGRNPLPVIIPCHRVLKSDGSIGGFSGGWQMKKRLLSLEASAGIK